MGSGHHGHSHHGLRGFQLGRGLGSKKESSSSEHSLPPKGWMAIRVGEDGGEQQRFLVPVDYLNHPLFARLLKEAEDVYGFDQKGAITIPCHVEHFRRVQGIIDRDSSTAAGNHHGHHHHHHHHHHHGHHNHHSHLHLHLAGCFRA